MSLNLMYHNIVLDDSKIESEYDITVRQLENDIAIVSSSDSKYTTFTFDDGKKGSLIAAKMLKKYNMQGIFFIITNKISEPGYIDIKEINEIHRMGHIIGSHSHTHPNFKKISDDEVTFELFRSKEILDNLISQKVTKFAFPGGQRKTHHSKIALELGYTEIYNSIEKISYPKQVEQTRFHIRQSNRGCVKKIIMLQKSYLLKRYLRSVLVEMRSTLQ